MSVRNVSFSGTSTHLAMSLASFLPTRWSNYSLEVWSPTEALMLHLELHKSFSDENFVWFKRLPRDPLSELEKRKLGTTEWSDDAIVAKAAEIVSGGAPYPSKKWHIFSRDHQSFVEALSEEITTKPPPRVTSPRLPLYRGPHALAKWDPKGPAVAFSSQTGKDAISDDWTGGKGMLWAYPGGPSRR